MAFAAIHNSSESKAHRVKALVLLLMFTLMLPISPVWASGESSSTAVSSTATAGEASSVQLENGEKKNDLTGFFTIGAIINVLFLGAFLLWARKESQKGKKQKAAGRK